MSPVGFEPAFPTSEWPQTPRPPGLAETFFMKYKTFANVDECFAMYITCEVSILKQTSIPAHEQLHKMKLSGLHFRPFVLLFAVCLHVAHVLLYETGRTRS